MFSNAAHSRSRTPEAPAPTPKLNPKTCLLTLNLHGAIALSGGTGAYKGISGKGTYQFNELAILAKSGGKCTTTKPPVASQVIIKATAAVKL